MLRLIVQINWDSEMLIMPNISMLNERWMEQLSIWVHGEGGAQYLISRVRAQEQGTQTSELQTKRKILTHKK